MNNLLMADILQQSRINKWYIFLISSQWWSTDEIELYQNKQLVKLISHVYCNVPYYSSLFKSLNLKPSMISKPKNLISHRVWSMSFHPGMRFKHTFSFVKKSTFHSLILC